MQFHCIFSPTNSVHFYYDKVGRGQQETKSTLHVPSAVVLSDLTDAAVWEPEYVCVESISTTLQRYQSLLHVLLLTARGVAARYRTQTAALTGSASLSANQLCVSVIHFIQVDNKHPVPSVVHCSFGHDELSSGRAQLVVGCLPPFSGARLRLVVAAYGTLGI